MLFSQWWSKWWWWKQRFQIPSRRNRSAQRQAPLRWPRVSHPSRIFQRIRPFCPRRIYYFQRCNLALNHRNEFRICPSPRAGNSKYGKLATRAALLPCISRMAPLFSMVYTAVIINEGLTSGVCISHIRPHFGLFAVDFLVVFAAFDAGFLEGKESTLWVSPCTMISRCG